MIDLALLKLHLRVDGGEEDDLISGYLEAAKAHIEQHCDRRLVDGEPVDPAEMALTRDVEQALLLLVGHWYSTRRSPAGSADLQSDPRAHRGHSSVSI